MSVTLCAAFCGFLVLSYLPANPMKNCPPKLHWCPTKPLRAEDVRDFLRRLNCFSEHVLGGFQPFWAAFHILMTDSLVSPAWYFRLRSSSSNRNGMCWYTPSIPQKGSQYPLILQSVSME